MLIGGRWLWTALVNPVPVSARARLGAASDRGQSHSDLFGRGTIIASHGSDESDEAASDEAKPQGVRGMFSGERTWRRQFLGRRGRPGIPTVMVEAFNVMQDRITRARLAGDPPDVLISPRLGALGLFDFHRGNDAIAIGADATQKSMGTINEAITILSQRDVMNGVDK